MLDMARPGGLHERTLLLVFGDHGQTLTGDHGGGSAEELDSALVAINLGAAARNAGQTNRSVDGAVPGLPQLDFAASLAGLLGLPIPAENVGARRNPNPQLSSCSSRDLFKQANSSFCQLRCARCDWLFCSR